MNERESQTIVWVKLYKSFKQNDLVKPFNYLQSNNYSFFSVKVRSKNSTGQQKAIHRCQNNKIIYKYIKLYR